jgi:hypothetical protein
MNASKALSESSAWKIVRSTLKEFPVVTVGVAGSRLTWTPAVAARPVIESRTPTTATRNSPTNLDTVFMRPKSARVLGVLPVDAPRHAAGSPGRRGSCSEARLVRFGTNPDRTIEPATRLPRRGPVNHELLRVGDR